MRQDHLVQTDRTPGAVLRRLREETGPAHHRLEADLDLLGGRLTVQRYRLLLERFLGFHQVLEPRLDAWHARAGLLDWPERRKRVLLERDLAELGSDHRAVLDCPDVPAVEDTADALGVLYVVEGGTLGGRMIADHLRGSAVPASALRFFSSYGDEVGSRWNRWRRTTAAWVGSDEDRAGEVVAAAAGTFAVLGRWLAPAARRAA